MKPNSNVFFDDVYDMISPDDDELIRTYMPSFIDDYKIRGYINEGDIIITPPIQKDIEINGHVSQFVEPGWVDVLNSFAGNGNWICQSKSDSFDLSKETLVYECFPYAKEELDDTLSKEVGLNFNDGKWIVSKHIIGDINDDYYSFAAELFQVSENQRYNVFAVCSYKDLHSASLEYEEMGLIYLGVFAIDRKMSFIHHRRIFRQIDNRIELK
jgi:hypothetical protein